MRRARDFNKRIELWQVSSTSDGAGGTLSSESMVASVWAKISTFKVPSSYQGADNSLLKNETGNALKITLRARNDFNYKSFFQFIVYRGVKYIVSTDPTNENLMNGFIEFVVVRDIKTGSQHDAIYPSYLARGNSQGLEMASATCTMNYINTLTNEITV